MGAVKNILFIMCDQLRADYPSCEGQPTPETPHLDALTARGVRFGRAFCQSPVYGPSHASLRAEMHERPLIKLCNNRRKSPISSEKVARSTDSSEKYGYRIGVCLRSATSRLEIPPIRIHMG